MGRHVSSLIAMEFSSPALELVVLLLALIPLLSLLYLRQDAKRQPRAAGLKVYPLLGTLPHFLKNHHRFLDWSTELIVASPDHRMGF